MDILDIGSQEYLNIFSTWGYAVILGLMIIEGPLTTLSAAFMASLGYFNIITIFFLSILGGFIGDIFLYLLGFYGGRPFLKKIEKFINFDRRKRLPTKKMEKFFENHGAKAIFYVKMTVGLCWITFLFAGISKMKLNKLIFFSLLGGIFWSFILSIIGYFFGYAAAEISRQLTKASGVIFGIFLLCVILFIVARKYGAKKLFNKR